MFVGGRAFRGIGSETAKYITCGILITDVGAQILGARHENQYPFVCLIPTSFIRTCSD